MFIGFENLEERRMMAVLTGTQIEVTGTAGNDQIRVSQLDANHIEVDENGVATFFVDANVNTIKVDAGAGNDSVVVVSNPTLPLTENVTLLGGDGNDTLVGGSGSDSIDGGAGNDSMRGGQGNDSMTGGAGNDTLLGEQGNDRLDAGSGDNQMFGGIGDDTLTAGTGADIFDGGAGTDLADYSNRTNNVSIVLDDVANDGEFVLKTVNVGVGGLTRPVLKNVLEGDDVRSSVENVTTGSGDDSIIGQVANVANKFNGGAGNDKLRGRAGNDTLLGGDGNDILVGAGQNDSLNGERGDDQIFGGAGADFIHGAAGNDIIDGGVGSDVILGDAGDDVILSADNEVDNVDGGAGNDILDADGTDVFSNVEIVDF